ncbi:MAG: MFS transporter [Pseudonocardiaceae bacterium]|nr:MFS transporter [Pseudonocardiaceae bacterium]
MVVSLMMTLVVPLLPRFPRLLDTTASNATWLVTGTLLAGAVSNPVLGRLGDMYGKRRMLLLALATMSVGSVLGAVADGYALVLVGRVLQGAAMGVIPLGISIMRDELPEHRVGTGIALMSSTLGIGGAIGLPLAGFVAQQLSWRWLFVGSAIIGVLDLLLVLLVVRESEQRPGGRFDLAGAAGLTVALGCLLLVISKGTAWGWTSTVTLGLAVVSVVAFVLWGRYELRTPGPLVDLRVSARPAVLLTNIASLLAGFAMFASFVVSSQMLQAPAATGYGFGVSLVVSGLLLLPIGLTMTAFAPLSARISRLRSPRLTVMLGGIVLLIGNVMRATLNGELAYVVVGVTVIGAGAALSYSALPMLIMQAVPMSETAAANSLNALMRTIGTSSCSAVVAAVTVAFTVDIAGRTYPSLSGYSVIFGLAAAAGLASTLLAAALPARHVRPAGARADAAGQPALTAAPE